MMCHAYSENGVDMLNTHAPTLHLQAPLFGAGSESSGPDNKSLFQKREYTLKNLKSSSPMLAQTSRPPTRNLICKTHDAGEDGATDDDIDDGILNADDRLHESLMKVSAMTLLGHAR